MEPLRPDVMIRQVERLPADLRELTGPFAERAGALLTGEEWTAVERVYLTGDGDSYHASCAAEMAYETLADIACEAISAQRFLDYRAPWMRRRSSGRPLVVAVSASGETARVVQAIQRAREQGALTVALTGTPESAVTRAADRVLLLDLPEKERSPGIRTYQASLVGMLLVAIRLGEARSGLEGDAPRRELTGLAGAVDATLDAVEVRCREVARAIADAPVMVMAGSGPSYGTALFAAAKMVEAAGVFALGQDLEEWWHVERFAYPVDMPVFVIAPPGRSHWRAGDLAAAARRVGRRVIAVTRADDSEVTAHADAVLPVRGDVREEFSPVLYHLFASCVAAHVTERLGRMLFRGDEPEFNRSVGEYFAGPRRLLE